MELFINFLGNDNPISKYMRLLNDDYNEKNKEPIILANKYNINTNLSNEINKDDYIKCFIYFNIINTLDGALSMPYRKSYGFASKISHTNQKLAVPYEYVDTPIKQSLFSDICLTIVLTFLTYLQEDISKEMNQINIYYYYTLTLKI